ncbi:3-deoxy-D-manno-octulosonic acid transferase [Geojedonia litorea]|uniref:3-deoxy-D-manno-octulosonic acid transferase n=1 Tax=Geojedonia litorea TaxID=1268269 RepID=A0ABV9N2F0_9FLAO
MDFIYNIAVYIARFHLKIIAQFNPKLKLGVVGRSEAFNKLSAIIKDDDKVMWFHCASLGEYEQGLPVFKVLRERYSDFKIVLSFFSPSGYEVRKNTPIADVVVYLPLDTKKNARRFLDITHPNFSVFVKYDIWPNYLLELKRRNLRAILISAAFRPNQSYFKFYGSRMRRALSAFEHIFVQNKNSKNLLKDINIHNVTLSGDTRYDRVYQQLEQNNTLDFIDEFKQNKTCVVIGSSWPEDEKLLVKYINNRSDERVKYIIAPHNIKAGQIETLKQSLNVDTALFSEKSNVVLKNCSVFIINTIGLLSKIYSYADIAYVGGAMGTTGLHNILEPAVFGTPIIIGKHYNKFPEANQMIEEAGVRSISTYNELENTLDQLLNDKTLAKQLGVFNRNFINKNKGAVIQITDYIRI